MANWTPGTYSPNINYTPANANMTSAKTGLPAYSGTVYPSQGSVLGASTQQSSGSSGGSRSAPSGTQNKDFYLNEFGNPVQITGPSQEEIDAQFNPIFDVYNQAENNLRSQQPGLIGEAEAQAKASQGLLENQKLSANELLGQQEQSTNTQRNRQTAQQRQTFQELQQANQQRFGSASSAGLGASELQGREFQKSQFGIQENAQQALQAIGQQKLEVDREYQQGLQQLEVNKQQAVNEINRRFQDKLLEINARRGETQAAKAQARMQAAQELRNQAFQINVARQQFEQELRLQAQSNMQYLSQAENQFTGAGQQGTQAYNQFASTTPTGMSNVSQTTGSTSPQLQGQMSRLPEDKLVGQISSQDLLRGSNPFGLPNYQNSFLGQSY